MKLIQGKDGQSSSSQKNLVEGRTVGRTDTLIIYHGQKRYHLVLEQGKTYEISDRAHAQLVFSDMPDQFLISLEEDGVYYSVHDEQQLLPFGQDLFGLTIYLASSQKGLYDPLQKRQILVGQEKGSDIQLESNSSSFLLEKTDQTWSLTVLAGQLYLNNLLLGERVENQILQLGDELAFEGNTIKVFPNEFMLSGQMTVSPALAEIAQSKYDFYPDYPDYHRSPRIIYRSSEEKVMLNAPASEPNKPKDELLKLIVPPLLMVGVTILISIFQPRGLYIIATMTMSVVTMIFSIQGYFKNRKQYKLDLTQRIDSYRHYLSDKAIALNELARAQKDGQLYHYPAIGTLDALAQGFSHRIYEKTPLHFDFLYYRLGLGEVPASYNLAYSQQERSGKKDALESEGYALYYKYLTIPDMPIVVNLSNGPVGYIGPRPLVLEQLQLMVNQLALFHSYHDVQFITIMPEEEKEQWDWMRWLPHASLQEMNVRGFVYNQRTRDQVLGSLNQILKMRKNQLEEKSTKEGTLFSPHYVVLVTDEKLILDHVIMEFFTEDPTELGCSLIFVQDVLSSLSENIKTIVNIKDRNTGQLVMEEGELKEIDFALDHFPENYDKERISRRLAPLNHLQNLKSSIPDSVTFMEMYGAETVEELNILERWGKNSPYKSLSVPLGLRGQDDIVYLNLHEKAHGPHGLVAGTTGSGKSEIIQSYILSLAVNFHPHDVAFLLIDYKGGGMANLFKDLPHLLGTITNLDGAQSMRALVSINAELKRRQRLFAENDVNHINQYQKKYKLGEVSEPMPHLFLISDEFAELKANQPDFMTELVSTARIGRSLGIHLILATQKPTGVVNDQIWSNSRFKLALKVADRQDSQEILRTPDAADITQAGRAYLQVGNNEVYELFQSAWSGADYQPEKDEQGIEDHTIYAINDLGQYEILNEDLSGLEEVEDIRQVPTELDAVVHQLKQLMEREGINALPQPWLPPLKERIYLPELHQVDAAISWKLPQRDLIAVIGEADVPHEQKQEAVAFNISKDGSMVLYGAPATGKTTFLQTITMDLARSYSPSQVNFYLLDFGTNGLAALSKLPHVADWILMDQVEKLDKLIRIVTREISKRKKLLSSAGLATIEMYRRTSQDTVPDIVLVLDNYDAVKGEPIENDFLKLLIQISREGLAIGVHLIMTASRQANLRAVLYSNFKHQLSLKQNDPSDVRSAVGRTDLADIEDIKGRAVMKRETSIDSVQLALPIEANNDLELIDKLREEVQSLSNLWTGKRPDLIPMVPDELTIEDFLSRSSVQKTLQEGIMPLGLEFENVEAIGIDLTRLKHILLTSDNDEGQQTITHHFLNIATRLMVEYKVMLVDVTKDYTDYQQQVSSYLAEKEILQNFSQQLAFELKERLEKPAESLKPWLIFIPKLAEFMTETSITLEDWTFLFEHGPRAKMFFIIGSPYQYVGVTSDAIPKKIRADVQHIVLGMRLLDQNFLEKVYNSKEPRLMADQVYLHNRRESILLKISTYGGVK